MNIILKNTWYHLTKKYKCSFDFVSDNNGNHNFTIFPITENGEGAHNYINFEDVLSELSYWCYDQPPFINFANLNKEAEVKNNHVDFNRHDRLPKYKVSKLAFGPNIFVLATLPINILLETFLRKMKSLE